MRYCQRGNQDPHRWIQILYYKEVCLFHSTVFGLHLTDSEQSQVSGMAVQLNVHVASPELYQHLRLLSSLLLIFYPFGKQTDTTGKRLARYPILSVSFQANLDGPLP